MEVALIREFYCLKTRATELSVTNNIVSAIKKSDITKIGLRLYDGKCIGVAGAIGAYDENKLEARARQMLDFKIPYECEPAREIKRVEDLSGEFALSDAEFLEKSETLLGMLSRNYPDFAFNHKIIFTSIENSLRNDCGADLEYKDKFVVIELYLKHKDSTSLMDSFGISLARSFDLEDAFNVVSETCACYSEKVALPDEKMPVVFLFDQTAVLLKFFTDLNGRMMWTGASLFSDKVGQKLFADHFSLCVERDPHDSYKCFFDAEGTVLPSDCFELIQNGVLKSAYASKRVASQFNHAITGSAEGDYDSVPDTSYGAIKVKSGDKTIKELLGGRKAVYVVMASGGDFTPQGEFATPVQAAFLFDGERLTGRLPQLSISSNIFDMYGKDYIGVSSDGKSSHAPFKYLALDMSVSTIGDRV